LRIGMLIDGDTVIIIRTIPITITNLNVNSPLFKIPITSSIDIMPLALKG
jgi:hypothetical protein